MIPFEILTKCYMNEEECDMLYNSQFEPMEFPWLSKIREWVNVTYNTRVLTIGLSPKGKRFLFYFYDKNDNIPRIYLKDGGSYEDMSAIDHKIAEVSGLNEKKFDSVISGDFVSQWKQYLTVLRWSTLSDQIKALFKNVNMFNFLSDKICIMNTKKDAAEFLLSEEFKAIKKQTYNLLKAYDKYDILEEKDIVFLIDYKENVDKWEKMYTRWADDMSDKEKIEYENSLINAYYEIIEKNINE